MARLGVSDDELLQAYQLSSLHPRTWEGAAGDGNAREPRPAERGGGADEWADPLGLRASLPPAQLSKQLRAQLSIGDKAFDAKAFLNTVHPNASFADLMRGAQQLRQNIGQRSEALKVLVDENFDRFVSVKATTDGVYHEMNGIARGPLHPDMGYGVQPLRTSIASASSKADDVFRPVLENYVKANKLRGTLGVFQRSHFFFNLPGTLREHVSAGNYDAALRDYKKGRFLLESRPGQLLPTDTSAGAPSVEHQAAQQRSIFAKVWDAVEEILVEMQHCLLAHLRDPSRSVEEQEKCIEYVAARQRHSPRRVLLELDASTDPAAVFLESQHRHIRSVLRSTFERECAVVHGTYLCGDD
ncbi:Exocyst complex component S5 [Malassezia sp. CBS 17886]|nr:Exocyst complex component S5 [Malassezia sp. CBS 17886]